MRRRFALAVAALSATIILMTSELAAAPRSVPIQAVTSPGGIHAWLVEDRTAPVISVEALFRGGATLDPPGREGLARLTMDLLDEGAGDFDARGFMEARDAVAAAYRFAAGLDTLTVGMRSLAAPADRDRAADLLALALSRPRFEPAAVERVRAQTLAALSRDAETPSAAAAEAWRKLAFADHPYARGARGTPAGIAAIGRAEIVAFPAQRLTRDRLIVGIAGALTAAEAGLLLDRLFGALPATAPDGPPLNPPTARLAQGGHVLVIDRPGPQTYLLFAQPGLARMDPDYDAALILNHILGGGGFTSRLTEELREKRGLTYGVSTGLSGQERAPLLSGGGSVRSEQAGEALALIRDVWRGLAEHGPTEAEVAEAKTYLTGSLPLQLESTPAIAGALTALQRDGLPIDTLDRRAQQIAAPSRDDVARVARRLLRLEDLLVVAVGRPVGVSGDLTAP